MGWQSVAPLLASLLLALPWPLEPRVPQTQPPNGAQTITAGWQDKTGLPTRGIATYYAPGLMELVYRNRLAMGHVEPCGECVGQVAMLRTRDLGRKVWLENELGRYGPFLVVDCAGEQDFTQAVQAGRVIEVSYEWATALNIKGPTWVKVVDD